MMEAKMNKSIHEELRPKRILVIFFAALYLVASIASIVLVDIFVMNSNAWLYLFLGWWFAPIPIIFLSILLDERRTKESLVGYTALSLLIPIFGNFLYLLVGVITYNKKFQDKYSSKVEDLLNRLSTGDRNSLDVGTPTTFQEAFVYKNASDYFNEIMRAIEGARLEICISFFYILQGRNRSAILKLLKDKIEKDNVKVYISFDGASKFFGAKNKDIKDLEKIGAKVETIKPFKFPFSSFDNNVRSHYKGVVVDSLHTYLGGANIGDLYAHQKRKMGYWNDSYFYMRGAAISNVIKGIISINLKMNIPLKERNIPQEFHSCQVVENQPEHKLPKHEAALKQIMKKCKRQFFFYSPYLVVPSWFLKGLLDMKNRGVDVKVIMPHFPDKRSVYVLAKKTAALLNSKGIKVLLLSNSYVHSKTIIFDNKVLSGSSNFDNRSFYLNYELLLYFEDSAIVNQFLSKWIEDEHYCIEWKKENNSLTRFEKIGYPFFSLFKALA